MQVKNGFAWPGRFAWLSKLARPGRLERLSSLATFGKLEWFLKTRFLERQSGLAGLSSGTRRPSRRCDFCESAVGKRIFQRFSKLERRFKPIARILSQRASKGRPQRLQSCAGDSGEIVSRR